MLGIQEAEGVGLSVAWNLGPNVSHEFNLLGGRLGIRAGQTIAPNIL